jgi:hypothetical protein
MRPALKSAIRIMAAALLVTTSACARPERLRTVSDFCLAAQRITAEPAPGANIDDPGNRFDTDETLFQVLEHNQVVDRLCPVPAPR